MTPPTSQKDDRKFIGLVNYFCYMCARLSYTLEALKYLTYSKVKFK